MEFNVNAPILFVLVGIIVAFVLAQSAFFLWRAVKRAKEIGLPQETVRKTISAAAIFTVARNRSSGGCHFLKQKSWHCAALAASVGGRLPDL